MVVIVVVASSFFERVNVQRDVVKLSITCGHPLLHIPNCSPYSQNCHVGAVIVFHEL